MSVFKDYEIEVINLLTQQALSDEARQKLFAEAEFVDLDCTGVGYYLTVRHQDLPTDRKTCHEPLVFGRARGIYSGFLVFLGNQELMLECHSWGEPSVPNGYREWDVLIDFEEAEVIVVDEAELQSKRDTE